VVSNRGVGLAHLAESFSVLRRGTLFTSMLFGAGLVASHAEAPGATVASSLVVSRGWTPEQPKVGADTPLYMTIRNPGAEDALVRARCPVANFVELRVLDHGEGKPSLRAVKRIAVPGGTSSTLDPETSQITLLQTTQILTAGTKFSCRLSFANAGAMEVEFQVGAPGANTQ
jgi:copper(I)-binding protein